MLPFVGVDGEGGNIADDYGFVTHRYTMLRMGDRYIAPPPDEPGSTAHTADYLQFIGTREKRKIFVSYFFDYDVTMMLRSLPEAALRVLVAGQAVRWNSYEISYRPRKELTVKYRGQVTTINDVGTFFQSKFVTALERWNIGTAAEREAIGEGKEQRATFGQLTSEEITYNALECTLLADLMEKFRASCNAIGYLPRRWQGPGQLAKAMFRTHGIPLTADLPEPPPGVWEMAQAAYYGGRFETTAVGPVVGPVEGWDINSAYPYACTQLPCLMHGGWTPTKSLTDHGVYRVSFTHSRPGVWYGLPVRTESGAIRFPRNGSGWYWGVELASAIRMGAVLTIHNGWRVDSDCDCRWFDFNWRLYAMRQALGKSEAGMTVKLAANSEYGVIAQSVGKAPYGNPVWAGLITAITRARLNEAIALDPDSVFMVATDGLFARPGLPLIAGTGLGEWDHKVYPDGIHIVQPGVYFTGDDHPKTRGVPATAIVREEEALRAAWQGKPSDGLSILLRQFNGLRISVAQNALYRAGQWMPTEKRITYDWSTKRQPRRTRRGHDAVRTFPYDGEMNTWTVPYDRMIGGNLIRDLDRLEWSDMPDWAETLTDAL